MDLTIKELREWTVENTPRIAREMGLPHWRIVTYYQRLDCGDDGFQPLMRVRVKPEYERAAVTIDLDACTDLDSIDEFEEHLCHEFCHIALSPLYHAKAVALELIPPEGQEAFLEIWQRSEEMAVRNIERLRRDK